MFWGLKHLRVLDFLFWCRKVFSLLFLVLFSSSDDDVPGSDGEEDDDYEDDGHDLDA